MRTIMCHALVPELVNVSEMDLQDPPIVDKARQERENFKFGHYSCNSAILCGVSLRGSGVVSVVLTYCVSVIQR